MRMFICESCLYGGAAYVIYPDIRNAYRLVKNERV